MSDTRAWCWHHRHPDGRSRHRLRTDPPRWWLQSHKTAINNHIQLCAQKVSNVVRSDSGISSPGRIKELLIKGSPICATMACTMRLSGTRMPIVRFSVHQQARHFARGLQNKGKSAWGVRFKQAVLAVVGLGKMRKSDRSRHKKSEVVL